MRPHAATFAEKNAGKTREFGKAGQIAPLPYREGTDRIRRCTSCGHITRFHWYGSRDPRFQGHLGTRWCQICAAFCPVERCTTKRGKVRSPAECRAVVPAVPRVSAPSTAGHPPTSRAAGGEAA